MRSRFLLLVVVSLALVALMGGTAFADTAADNAQCLTCHGPGGGVSLQVDFGVGTVDRATACNKCHWGEVGSKNLSGCTEVCHVPKGAGKQGDVKPGKKKCRVRGA